MLDENGGVTKTGVGDVTGSHHGFRYSDGFRTHSRRTHSACDTALKDGTIIYLRKTALI